MEFSCGKVKIIEGRFNKKNLTINKNIIIDIPVDLYSDGIIYDMEQLNYLINNSLKQYEISTKDVTLVINSSRIITRAITIPKVSHEEIKSILQFQVSDYIPIEPEDYIVQYLVTGKFLENNVERLKLLLISIPKDMVEAHLNLVKTMELNPHILDFQGNTITKLINYNEIINDKYPIDNTTIASIDLAYDTTNITISKNGNIEISRVLDMGLSHILEDLSRKLNISPQEIERYLTNNSNLNEFIEPGNQEFNMEEILLNSFVSILEDAEIVFRYHINRDISNSIDLILLLGQFNGFRGSEEFITDFFNIESLKLKFLDRIKFGDELGHYANVIGSIIRKEEVVL